jgi:hypothetical protein
VEYPLGLIGRWGIVLIHQGIGPNLPIAGFYSYGEYSPMKCHSASYLHNETTATTLQRK